PLLAVVTGFAPTLMVTRLAIFSGTKRMETSSGSFPEEHITTTSAAPNTTHRHVVSTLQQEEEAERQANKYMGHEDIHTNFLARIYHGRLEDRIGGTEAWELGLIVDGVVQCMVSVLLSASPEVSDQQGLLFPKGQK
ncbi:hypothetical protein CPC08DRAFT_730311, partial [Agrocybe pediades]